MSESTILTFSIGPVHTFITQARRVADLWAGSALLSQLIETAVAEVFAAGGEMIFPYVEDVTSIPPGLPNRFVCRFRGADATAHAEEIAAAVRGRWRKIVEDAVAELKKVGIIPHASLWPGTNESAQTDAAIDIAWSWVPEDGGYKAASDAGARQFAAMRMFRQFMQIGEQGLKCAVCGERTALPDGDRANVKSAWESAGKNAKDQRAAYFRLDQSRLCLVCAAKRLYPLTSGQHARFASFHDFEPAEKDKEAEIPYFAVVTMDGDRLGEALAAHADDTDTTIEAFQKRVSGKLAGFAASLRTSGAALNLETLHYRTAGRIPQLIYAGGEDVVFICDTRDAIPLARAVREHYRKTFAGEPRAFTISAGVLFAHTKYPAGLLFREADDLLNRKAKEEAGRDAIAIRLNKRGGVPVEVAFRWDEGPSTGPTWIDLLTGEEGLVRMLHGSEIASRQTYSLVQQVAVLGETFDTFAGREKREPSELWVGWITNLLSRGEGSSEHAEQLAAKLAPFFIARKTTAFRIARFLAVEVPS